MSQKVTRYSRGWLLVSVATNNVNSVHSIIAVVIKFTFKAHKEVENDS